MSAKLKKSFGRDTILMEFEGNPDFIIENPNFKVVNQTAHRLELKIISETFDLKSFISTINERLIVYKFELVEPSIHEIFIQSVKGSEVKVG